MTSVNSKRIAKNTLLLYVRMAVAMLVSLYTSRVVLQALGVEDFGIWSVVGTLVVMISFITSPLATATQRFINVALGQNDDNKASRVFSQSLILYACFAVAMFIIFETIGLWFLNTKMDIPTDRIDTAIYVFHIAVASFVLMIFRVPFEAITIAHQQFKFYAIIGIIDVFLKLLVVFLLPHASNNEVLVFYAFLLFVVSAFILSIYFIFVRYKYKIYNIRWIWDKVLINEILSFMGWTIFGTFASISGTQGISLIMNIFFGVAANTAMGLANQVANAINQFVSNFQNAFQPQLVQSYAANERETTFHLVCFASKISFFLIFAIGCPLIFNIEYVLSLWLNEVPFLTPQFCIPIICISILEALSAPLWMTVQATGKIREYQLVISFLLMSTIVVGYILYKLGFAAPSILYVKVGVLLLCLIYRIYAVHKLAGISTQQLLKGFLWPELMVTAITLPIMCFICYCFPSNGVTKLLWSTLIFIISLTIVSVYILLTTRQRNQLLTLIRSKIFS